MASVRTLVTMKRGGQYHPPGSVFHGLSEAEVTDLGPHAERLPGALGSPVAADEPAPAPTTDDARGGLPEPSVAADEPEDDEGPRVETIALSIDLLDAVDFETDGRPKLGPLADVLGFVPTASEIETALAMREEEGL